MYDVQRREFKVVAIIEPGTGKVKETQAGASGKCEGIDHELGDRPLVGGAGFVVEDVDAAVANLEHVDVAGDRGSNIERNVKAEYVCKVVKICWCEIDGHFHRHGHGIGQQHEALQLVMSACVVRDGL